MDIDTTICRHTACIQEPLKHVMKIDDQHTYDIHTCIRTYVDTYVYVSIDVYMRESRQKKRTLVRIRAPMHSQKHTSMNRIHALIACTCTRIRARIQIFVCAHDTCTCLLQACAHFSSAYIQTCMHTPHACSRCRRLR